MINKRKMNSRLKIVLKQSLKEPQKHKQIVEGKCWCLLRGSPETSSARVYNVKLDQYREYRVGYEQIPTFDGSYEGSELIHYHYKFQHD